MHINMFTKRLSRAILYCEYRIIQVVNTSEKQQIDTSQRLTASLTMLTLISFYYKNISTIKALRFIESKYARNDTHMR